jgi:hypothetical protein
MGSLLRPRAKKASPSHFPTRLGGCWRQQRLIRALLLPDEMEARSPGVQLLLHFSTNSVGEASRIGSPGPCLSVDRSVGGTHCLQEPRLSKHKAPMDQNLRLHVQLGASARFPLLASPRRGSEPLRSS